MWQKRTVDDLETVAREAAARAGEILRRDWRRSPKVIRKSNPIDLVTETDRKAESVILETIRGRFPDHAILAEESGAIGADACRWIIDPLDGTTNFAHGYPQVSVSIAVQRDGETVLGVVLDPLRDEIYVARRGDGAFRNDERIHVAAVDELSGSLLGTGFPYDRREHADFYLAYVKAFMLRAHGIRRGGSAALDLCMVASGVFAGFWEWRLHPWDVAAGALLVEEAGGRVSGFGGEPFDPFGDQILATNGKIHEEMHTIIAEIGTEAP